MPGWRRSSRSALALVAGWRFFPSSEYIIGGKDPGVYVNEGIQIAQRGAIAFPIRWSPRFRRSRAICFFPLTPSKGYYLSLRFMGFFVRESGHRRGDWPVPARVPGVGRDRLRHRRSDGRAARGRLLGLLGLLAVYFAGARLFGRPAAAAAATLLALNVVQVWFARYPNIEMLMQALLFAALLANARAHVDDDPFFAPVAGVLAALLLFARFDTAIAVAGLSGRPEAGLRRPAAACDWTFWAPLAAGMRAVRLVPGGTDAAVRRAAVRVPGEPAALGTCGARPRARGVRRAARCGPARASRCRRESRPWFRSR